MSARTPLLALALPLALPLALAAPLAAGGPEFGGLEIGATFPGWVPRLGDLDGDGILDVAYRQDTSPYTLATRLGVGDGTFGPEVPVVDGQPVGSLRLGDLNGDGILDVVCTGADVVHVYLGAGDGSLSLLTTMPVPDGELEKVALGDTDGDGDLDVVVFVESAALHPQFFNDGTGLLTSGPGIIMLPFDQSHGALGDLDGDGDLDAAFSFGFNENFFRTTRNTGDGTFEDIQSFPITTTRPDHLTIADLDGDGALDVAIADDAQMVLAFNAGDGTFPVVESIPVPGAQYVSTAVDLEGDGDLDLVVGSWAVRVLLNDGTGSFTVVPGAPAATAWMSIGDVDGNGTPDVATSGAGSVRVLMNATAVVPPGPFVQRLPDHGATNLPLPDALAAWPGTSYTAPVTWDPASGFGITYGVTVARDPLLTDVVASVDGLEATTWNLPLGVLDPGTEYFWLVSATNPQGVTSSTDGPFTFTTKGGADLDGDGFVGFEDLLVLLAAWGTTG